MGSIEHPVKENLDEVFAFLIQCDIADFGEPDTSREDLEEDWNFIDLTKDAWVVRDEGGRLDGYAFVHDVSEGCHVDVQIEPNLSPARLEDELLKLCIERAGERVAGKNYPSGPFMIGYATSTNTRVQKAYERSGFTRHAWHYRMQIDLSQTVENVTWPDNYRLHSYRPEDELELYEMIQSAFNWQGHVEAPIEQWRSLVFRGGNYDPACFILLRDGGELVGAALAYDDGGSGWIRQLAIRRDHQGKGLGGMLLRHMFHFFQQRGATYVALGVAAVNEKAYQFYERNGMRRKREFIEYRKPI